MTMVLDGSHEWCLDDEQEFEDSISFADYYYPITSEDGEFEDGCADLLEKIYNIRQYQDLGPVDRAVLDIIEELIELL